MLLDHRHPHCLQTVQSSSMRSERIAGGCPIMHLRQSPGPGQGLCAEQPCMHADVHVLLQGCCRNLGTRRTGSSRAWRSSSWLSSPQTSGNRCCCRFAVSTQARFSACCHACKVCTDCNLPDISRQLVLSPGLPPVLILRQAAYARYPCTPAAALTCLLCLAVIPRLRAARMYS